MRPSLVFLASIAVAVAALAGGGVIIAFYGFTLPPWLLTCELAVFAGLGMLCGFSAILPSALPFLKMRAVQGSALVCAGVAAVFIPAQFVASAVFLALGIKLVWAEACSLADAERQAEQAAGTVIVRHAAEVAGTELIRTGGNGTLAASDQGDDAAAPARKRAGRSATA